MVFKKIYIASDHAGFEAKEKIRKYLEKKGGIECEDLGPYNNDPVDYPIYAKKVANLIIRDLNIKVTSSVGILICGSGAGMQIAANRFKKIRAVFCFDEYSAQMARKDNNANILTLRGREFSHRKYNKIIDVFLETKFSNLARHRRRIKELENLK